MLYELTPTQDAFQALRVPHTLDEGTAADWVDRLQDLLPLWRVSLSVDAITLEHRPAPYDLAAASGQAKPGDWILLKDGGAFAIVSDIDAGVLFDVKRAE